MEDPSTNSILSFKIASKPDPRESCCVPSASFEWGKLDDGVSAMGDATASIALCEESGKKRAQCRVACWYKPRTRKQLKQQSEGGI